MEEEEEEEEEQEQAEEDKEDKVLENTSNKITSENFPKQKKVPVNVQEASKIPTTVRKSPFPT